MEVIVKVVESAVIGAVAWLIEDLIIVIVVVEPPL